jgi:hypothetical protein
MTMAETTAETVDTETAGTGASGEPKAGAVDVAKLQAELKAEREGRKADQDARKAAEKLADDRGNTLKGKDKVLADYMEAVPPAVLERILATPGMTKTRFAKTVEDYAEGVQAVQVAEAKQEEEKPLTRKDIAAIRLQDRQDEERDTIAELVAGVPDDKKEVFADNLYGSLGRAGYNVGNPASARVIQQIYDQVADRLNVKKKGKETKRDPSVAASPAEAEVAGSGPASTAVGGSGGAATPQTSRQIMEEIIKRRAEGDTKALATLFPAFQKAKRAEGR